MARNPELHELAFTEAPTLIGIHEVEQTITFIIRETMPSVTHSFAEFMAVKGAAPITVEVSEDL